MPTSSESVLVQEGNRRKLFIVYMNTGEVPSNLCAQALADNRFHILQSHRLVMDAAEEHMGYFSNRSPLWTLARLP